MPEFVRGNKVGEVNFGGLLHPADKADAIERGMPYSGVWVTRHVTKYPGDQVVKDENTKKVWRDSEGTDARGNDVDTL